MVKRVIAKKETTHSFTGNKFIKVCDGTAKRRKIAKRLDNDDKLCTAFDTRTELKC